MAETTPADPVAAKVGYLRACTDAAIASPESSDLPVLLAEWGRALAALEAARKLITEWDREADALNAAAARVAESDRFAPGIGLKHARSAAYAECAGKLEMAISRKLLGGSPPLPDSAKARPQAEVRRNLAPVPAGQQAIARLAHCRSGGLHDWQPDPQHRREGYACTECGVTEAELEARDG